ncbi:DNA-binding transcriptional ArsR family regulator [Breznakia blatticola]|uniref:DNA-binding transcriptional ArsR family regulator n=1 Tax=Breznakia blatticola TaxID=1754012 RepID=A0A4R7ZTJ1_9FIRM|nr:metalloregulator ArsR/SmtB family transcription factor [Breznakia blatticola]TDW20995.1 DNA-binding transcriptional ArsR family regulator [Breznakia blatticola]
MENRKADECQHTQFQRVDELDAVEAEELAIFFKMYADATRLKILHVLFKGEMCVQCIADELEMSQSAISHQLAILKRNRIIKSRRDKKNMFYSLDDRHIELIFNAAYEHMKE